MNARILSMLIAVLTLPNFISAKALDKYGIMAAYSSSNVTVDQIDDFSFHRTGLGFGVFAEWLNSPWFSVLTQAQYVQKGFRERAGDTSQLASTILYNARLDYLSFPILAKLSYSKSPVAPYLVAGPRFDFLFHRRNGRYETTSTAQWAPESDFAQSFKDLAIGGTFGAGLDLRRLGPVQPSIEFNYNLDFSTSATGERALFDGTDTEDVITRPFEVKNRSFDVWVKLAF